MDCFEEWLKPGERLDDLERNGYKLIQNPKHFCFGMDAVLLTGFAKVYKGESVLDLGTGTGIIPILLKGKTEGAYFTGLEIQAESVDMAKRSVLLNGLLPYIEIIEGDIKEASTLLKGKKYHAVTSNPPYITDQGGLINARRDKALARHEILCTLEDVIREGAGLLEPGGRFYMVHRPFRLPELFSVFLHFHMEPKRMRLVYPHAGQEPNLVLLECIKGGGKGLKIEKPLILCRPDGSRTEEVEQIYSF